MFLRSCFFACLFLMVGVIEEVANAQVYRKVGNKILPYKTIIVDPSGYGNFTTIQSAIDSIPPYNKYWTAINVKAGIYREKVTIDATKPFIMLKGAGKRRTIVEWGDHQNTIQSATFTSFANNVVAKSISFRNTYNNPINNNEKKQAVAALISGDKAYFFRVGFYGLQDTLWDHDGRHYYKLCTIQGAVDFIFGNGQTIFERCSINVIGSAYQGLAGFITAQGREDPNTKSGFVFKECHIFGNGTAYLGRPWRPYARVLFYKTNMTNVVEPNGWEVGKYAGHENDFAFAEYGNFGPGSDTSKRVNWSNKMALTMVNEMASMNFINTEEWLLNSQPL